MLNNLFNAFYRLMSNQISALPYPEESPDYNLNITGEALLQQFFIKYHIPEVYRNFWRSVIIKFDKTLPYPAGMISQTKTLLLKPEYANPGIVAHEFSHLSYAELSQDKRGSFATQYNSLLQTDGLMKLLYSQKPYMKTNIVEAHAEVFRYLGDKMPSQLNKYYPKLFLPPHYHTTK